MRWPRRRPPPILPRVADRESKCEVCGLHGDLIRDPQLGYMTCLACYRKLPRPAAIPVDEPTPPLAEPE